jgi:hypothetical protein
MADLATKLRPENLFPGEFDAIETEFCGTSPVSLLRLGTTKRDRLLAWLRFPKDERQAAFEEVKQWASAPIAAALHLLQNPARRAPARPPSEDKPQADDHAWW